MLQDIPRTNDHAPTKTIYTWKVDLAAAAAQLATNMVKGVCNLQDRLQTELNKRHQVQQLTLFPLPLPLVTGDLPACDASSARATL